MARIIAEDTELVSEEVDFKWTIRNFSTEKLLKGANHVESPSFKCFNTDFHLKMCRSSEKVFLHLAQSNVVDRLWISECKICFDTSRPSIYNKKFTSPEEISSIFHEISLDILNKHYVYDNVLTVGCKLQATTLRPTIDGKSGTQQAGNEKKNFSKQGHTTLSEDIGSTLENSRFTDITLKVGEESFQAHRTILASRSKVFDGMFQSDMKESQESVVEMMDIKPTIVKQMLQYIYAGTMEALSMEETINLYVGADRYDLQELKGWCKEFILKHISPDDVCKVAVIADLHSDEELAKSSRRVFKENPKTIVGSETWRDFGKKNPALQTDLLESALIIDFQV